MEPRLKQFINCVQRQVFYFTVVKTFCQRKSRNTAIFGYRGVSSDIKISRYDASLFPSSEHQSAQATSIVASICHRDQRLLSADGLT